MVTGILGTIVGIIGTFLSRGFDSFDKHLQRKEKAAEREHELKLLEKHMQQNRQETENELLIANQQADQATFSASINHDISINDSYRWVNAVRSLVRPVLTIGLVLISFAIFYASSEGIRYTITASLLEMTAASITWWFGSRHSQKFYDNLK